jgi:hypothetical protein
MKSIKEILERKSQKLFRDYVLSINSRLQKGLKKLGHSERENVISRQIFWSICRLVPIEKWEHELKLVILWEGKNSCIKRKIVRKALKVAGCDPTISRNFTKELDC